MSAARRPRLWRRAALLFGAIAALLLVVYRDTAATFPAVWSGSDTYTHCFFVIPVTAFLVWRRRAALAAIAPEPFLPGAAAVGAAGALWLVANAAGVLFHQQLALALMIPALVITLFGLRVARLLTFPLAFFLLAVPFGEALHPPLMRFTAHATVLGLRLTGVPVAVEGLYLATPTSRWQVVEACSGLRFLISMFTLGCLYAYLHFRTPRNRLIFALLALVVPILANGLRAYVMVMAAHLSGNRVGFGVDHYAIGWTVFAVVMALFFVAGSRWRERSEAGAEDDRMREGDAVPSEPGAIGIPAGSPARDAAGASGRRLFAAGAAALLLATAPHAAAAWSRSGTDAPRAPLAPPPGAGGWAPVHAPPPLWTPGYQGATEQVRRVYVKDDQTVDCIIAIYREQGPGRELVGFANVIVPRGDPRWRAAEERDASVTTASEPLEVHETDVRSSSMRYLVWHWYWLPDEFTISRSRAKLLQARSRLFRRRDDAAVVILLAPYADDPGPARARLMSFTRAMLPSLRESLRSTEQPR